MAHVNFNNISKSFGDVKVLSDISLEVNQGEFLVLVGPSGCGKSTLLRILAGLEQPTSGDVLIDGKSVISLDPKERQIAMVFQNYALYPHMTVFENLAFTLKLKNLPQEEIKKRVQETAEVLQIQSLLERKPKALSGGQRQRVALGRALVRKANIVLFDEPLSNLDANLRNQMRYEIKKLHQLTKATMIYVTHDQVEATTLGTRIALLNKGQIEQVGSPLEIYEKPKNTFVASFIGLPEINILQGQLFDKPNTLVGLRPEDISVVKNSKSGLVPARLEVQEYLGSNYLIYARINEYLIRAMSATPVSAQMGDTVYLDMPLTKAIQFDKSSGIRLQT